LFNKLGSSFLSLENSETPEIKVVPDPKLEQELKDQVHKTAVLKEKAAKLEQDLKDAVAAKAQLEIALENQYNDYSQEICEAVIDNMILSLQIQEMNEYIQDYFGAENEKLMFSRNKAPVKHWFQIIGQNHAAHQESFSLDRFSSFVEKFSTDQKESTQIYKLYDWSFQSWKSSEKPRLFSALAKEVGEDITDEAYEVHSVLDNMILILEIQEDMENQVNLDLRWLKHQAENTSSINNLIAPTRFAPRESFEPNAPHHYTNIQEVQSSDIFIKKYNHKLKKIKMALNPVEKIASNSVSCDTKLLEKMISINQETGSGTNWYRDLIMEMTNLFINTYNYSIYLYQQW